MVTRRCAQRQFLLRPSKVVNQVVLYLLAHAAERFLIDVHCYCVLSNHYHLIVTDRLGNLPAFTQLLNCLVARALNAYYGRRENVWTPGSYSAVTLVGEEDVIDKTVYVLANPVAAGLVSHGDEWPGLRSSPQDFGTCREIIRPAFFFQDNGSMPDRVSLNISAPPLQSGLSQEQLTSLVEKNLESKEADIRNDMDRRGRRFAGVRAVRRQSPLARPGNAEPYRKLNPRFACRDKERRIDALLKYKRFLREYRSALTEFCAGLREALFPFGTYWMRVHFAARCAPMPP